MFKHSIFHNDKKTWTNSTIIPRHKRKGNLGLKVANSWTEEYKCLYQHLCIKISFQILMNSIHGNYIYYIKEDMTRYDTMWHYIKEDMTRFSNWRLRCNFEIQYFCVIIPRNRQSMNFFKRSPASAPPTSPQKWTFNKLTKAEVINLQVTHFRTSRRVICH